LEGEEAVSSVAISYSSNRRNLYINILGTDGALYLDLPSMLMIRQGRKKSMGPIATARYLSDVACQVARGVTANAIKVLSGNIRYGHNILIEEFVNSVINGQQPPVTGEDGREATRVIEMIVERLHQKYGTAYKTK